MTREEALDKAIGILTYHQVNFCKSKKAVAYMSEIIEALEKINQEPKAGHWVPVSERLPEKNVWVLVTVEKSGNRYQEIMRRNKYIEAWTDDIDNYTDEITAWMPLSEPYKESEASK